MLAYGAEGGVEGYGVVHVLYIIRYGMVVWLSLVPRVDELGEGRAAAWRERKVDGVVARRLGLREACAGLGNRGVAALQLALCLEHALLGLDGQVEPRRLQGIGLGKRGGGEGGAGLASSPARTNERVV